MFAAPAYSGGALSGDDSSSSNILLPPYSPAGGDMLHTGGQQPHAGMHLAPAGQLAVAGLPQQAAGAGPQGYLMAPQVMAAQQHAQQAAVMAAAPAPRPLVQVGLQLSGLQAGALSGHLYSVAAMSGCDVSTVPAGAGVFVLHLTGSQAQVDAARQLVSSLLAQLQAAGMV